MVSVETVIIACTLSAIGGAILTGVVESVMDWMYQRKQEKVQQRMAVREAQRREEMEMERRRVDIVRHMRGRV